MSCKNYKIDEVIRSLSKKGVIITFDRSIKKTLKKIDTKLYHGEYIDVVKEEKNVLIPPMRVVINNAKELGNGSWGKIDYLENYRNYTIIGRGVYKKRLGIENR